MSAAHGNSYSPKQMSAQKPMIGDAEVANAIHAIAVIIRDANASLRKAASRGTTSALLNYLISVEELGAADRELLHDLLAGELGRSKGRSGLRLGEIRFRCDAIEAVRKETVALKAKGTLKPREKAIKITADRIGRAAGNLRHWLTIPKVLAPEMKRRKQSVKNPLK